MSGRPSRDDRRTRLRVVPTVEGLDARALLAGSAVGHSLGTFFVPGTNTPRVSTPAVLVNVQPSINNFLIAQLGPGLSTVVKQSQILGAASNNLVAHQVLSQQYVKNVLGRQDTYTLLNAALGATAGTFSNVYPTTAPVVHDALKTASSRPAPNAPKSVPGLRLPSALVHNRNFSSNQSLAFVRAFHTAVNRGVFTLSPQQTQLIGNAFNQFTTQVTALNQSGAFQPGTPLAAPTLPVGPLNKTIEVSLGAIRNLNDVPSVLSGLQLPVIGNFPGRIDVGFVFDKAGNFGIAFTARGPLSGSPKGVASPDAIGGDIRIEVSNAPSLTALNGQHLVEGLTQGSALSGGMEASTSSSGVSTFSTSIGYGSGLEFGTGLAYTQVVPLGNVNSLIPEFPKG
jgi:hypothetical protein